jgi:uncharacterized protein YbaP (TraB family)
MRKFIVGLAAMLAVTAGPALAQTDHQWSDIAEVTVKARLPGPVLWKLTKGDSTVWVLGVLPAQFENTRWEQTRLRRVVKSARVMIIPAAAVADKEALVLSEKAAMLPPKVYLADVVSPVVYDRFRKTVLRENLPIDAYTRLRPKPAGDILFRNVTSKLGLTTSMPEYVAAFAQKYKVKVVRAGQVDSSTLVNHMTNLDAAAGEACLVNFLDGIDYDENVFPKVVKAWGKGDLKTVTQNYQDQPYLACDLANPDSAAFIQTYAVDMMVEALGVELETPGKSVAVVEISDLLRKDGVLDKLRAQGVEVTSPDM